ncbi:MAG: 16S rRNA (cytosine(1402)-N(4))-methyltransferase RsmH [Bacteroidales bacterium]|nr:16S rRNA (cytosine(1402)-N(4))-methyltransferase RsmH [Bacteroidales bacterium]
MQEQVYHIPALLEECIQGLNISSQGTYVDVTFGGGGHSKEILKHLSQKGHLYSFDQDEDAEQNIPADNRFTFVRSNFRFLSNFMMYYDVEEIDGLLADLGVSFHHFDEEERGFSFRFDGKLDMRMNARAGMTAADILNDYEEEKLADVFYLYGEMRNSRRIASAIIRARSEKKFDRIADFLDVVKPFVNRKQEKKELAQIFQALRIEVNKEMEALQQMLSQALSLLKPGGRLVVLTYHSLEDRIVKNFMKTGNFEGKANKDFFGRVETPFKLVNNKVIVASEQEVERNPRSRSAKLRIAEKL